MLHATGGSRRYNLHAALQPLGANYMRQAASRMQTLHALAAGTVQRHQFFERTLQEQFRETVPLNQHKPRAALYDCQSPVGIIKLLTRPNPVHFVMKTVGPQLHIYVLSPSVSSVIPTSFIIASHGN